MRRSGKISRLFYDWDETFGSQLNEKTKRFISKAQELNAKWKSAIRGERESFTLSDRSWVELIEKMEAGTAAFLKENRIGNIEEVWLKRSEIK